MRTLVRLLREANAPEELIALAERLASAEVPETTDESSAEDRLLTFGTDVEPLTDPELTQLSDGLRALGNGDDAAVELINAAADACDVIATEVANRDAAAAEVHAERDAARARLNGDTGGDTDGGEAGDDTVDETAEVDDPEPEADPAPEPTGDDEGTVDETAEEDELVGATASGRRVSRADLLARRPRSAARRAAAPPADPVQEMARIEFAHDVPDISGGTAAANLTEVDRALERKRDTFRNSRRSKDGTIEYLRVATVHGRFPEERRLCDADGQAFSAVEMSRRIQTAIDQGIQRHLGDMERNGGLVAAGGICALPTPIYNVVTLGDTRRPIRDQALVSFQTARGGVTDLTPPTLPSILTGDSAAAISEWTEQNDTDAAGGSPTKPCQRIVCGSPRTTKIYAVTNCLTVGNFLSRTFPELQNAWTSLAMVAQARFAEALMFARLIALSTATTNATTDWSASRDVLAILDQTAAGMRSRHRLSPEFPFIVILPETLLPVLRTDIARSLPGGSFQENLTLAQAEINQWFAARFITPIWSPDVNVIGAQGATTLAQLPPTISYVMYPAGTFIHLDAGELDLGVVRDTVTNSTNDFQIWSESMENIHKVGPESISGVIDVCPSGAVSGTIDPAPFCASYT